MVLLLELGELALEMCVAGDDKESTGRFLSGSKESARLGLKRREEGSRERRDGRLENK